MRVDAQGLFWFDEIKIKAAPKVKLKATPPERVWEHPDYLPNLVEALNFDYRHMSDMELMNVAFNRTLGHAPDKFIFDAEVYENYFFVAFEHVATKRCVYFEKWNDQPLDYQKLKWMLETFCTVGFNSLNYDMTIMAMVLAGKTTQQIKQASDMLIQQNMRPADVLKRFKVKRLKNLDHIDLIEVAPLSESLKIYGGRLHTRRMQDLPFPPETIMDANRAAIIRWYCVNDLETTHDLLNALKEPLDLRDALGKDYGLDLRSKSDAQIAEAVIVKEVEKVCGYRIQKPMVQPGDIHKYEVPAFLRFQTPLMNQVLCIVADADFIVGENKKIASPPTLAGLQIRIGNAVYTMGIGGLHSTEKTCARFADAQYGIADIDVSSCYPKIILELGLYPPQMGQAFLPVYGRIVDRRLAAKAAKDKRTANSLKITINGSFGKFGDAYSRLNSPRLLIQTTLTGQLGLLMLIERLELAGFEVISGNTDGIAVRYLRSREAEFREIIKQWERDTNYETEETQYAMLLNRDVNNYIAVQTDMKTVKCKGIFANPWNNPKDQTSWLFKNPTSTICSEAIENFLTKQVPIEQTIYGCKDIKKFVQIRKVKGGGVKLTPEQPPLYLGKAVRWYYATGTEGSIVAAGSGNKVSRTDEGAKPCMLLPQELPSDLNHDWYLRETRAMMQNLGLQVAGDVNVIEEEA